MNGDFKDTHSQGDTARDPLDVAAYWHGVFDENPPSAEQRTEFEGWLAADPAHRAAFKCIERDVAKATSWREGQIIFDDDTLAMAAAEVNRYSAKKIVLADPRLAELRMSGVFIAGHSDSFVETITGNFPIKVSSDPHGQIVLTTTK